MFKLDTEINPGIESLLLKTTLGTQGAKYQHLNTKERIQMLENPLFLSIERNKKTIANITFCRRAKKYYIRFFAFEALFQGSTKYKSQVKKRRNQFVVEITQMMNRWLKTGGCDQLYAYIDSKNIRSMNMAHQFGFSHQGTLITHAFSRLRPKLNRKIIPLSIDHPAVIHVKNIHAQHTFYFDQEYTTLNYVGLQRNGEIIGVVRVLPVSWKIIQLPGRFGKWQVKLLPYIPFLKDYINPKQHDFLAIDQLWVSDYTNKVTEELLEGVLAMYQHKVALWWADEQDPFRQIIDSKIKWGFFDRIIRKSKVHVMVKSQENGGFDKPFYVCAYDLV